MGADHASLVATLWPGGAETRVGEGRVIASRDIEEALARIGVAPDFVYAGGSAASDIPFVHRKLSDGESYFLVNRADRAETIKASFRVTGKAPELWHADTGSSESVSYRVVGGETVVPMTLGAGESVHVVFRRPLTHDSMIVDKPAPVELSRLHGPWTVKFEPGRGAPETISMPRLAPFNESSVPGIKYFSGIATYTREFTAPKGWKPGRPLWLDLGDVHELAEVSINGQMVGAVWHAPFRLNLGTAVRRGQNRLEIRVANLWVNRLIGDAQPNVAEKATWTALPTYRTDAPLKPSGLIGPVTLSGDK